MHYTLNFYFHSQSLMFNGNKRQFKSGDIVIDQHSPTWDSNKTTTYIYTTRTTYTNELSTTCHDTFFVNGLIISNDVLTQII